MRTSRVLLLGATGLIGRELLQRLLDDPAFDRIVVPGRRATGFSHAKLEEHVFDLAMMESHSGLFAVDQIFCALGTTMRQARSRDRFRRVDHDYPVTAAHLGLRNGARHFLLVSSSGASSRSPIFYSRVKGEVERDLLAIGYPALTIARPSFLTGEREEKRRAEQIVTKLGRILPARYAPIAVGDVAAALVNAAKTATEGVRILRSAEMQGAAGR